MNDTEIRSAAEVIADTSYEGCTHLLAQDIIRLVEKATKPVDDWQARALAAEKCVETLEQELADVNDEGPQSPEWRRMMETRADFLSRAIAAEADVARLRAELRSTCDRCKAHAAIERLVPELDAMPERLPRLVGKPHPAEVDARCEQHYALYTPTPPDAVAALVRAARDVVSTDEGEWNTYHRLALRDTLAALLDAPPWRNIR